LEGKNLTVLLVDDNPHMRLMLGQILRALGVRRIHEAGDGTEALQVMRDHAIDIVMTDLAMQPVDGIDFVRLLRNSPDSPNALMPVIMITGHTTPRRVAEARDVGVNELLVKPITARGVIDRLTRVIEHPRPFVRSPDYFGPDRRRKGSDAEYAGPFRRASDRDASDGGAPGPDKAAG
jgi:two-component system, chemotaxis family, chemotaxis protein CheY